MLIQEKSDEKRNNITRMRAFIGKIGAHFTNQSAEKKCYFSIETVDYIATAGLRGTEIIQYFACKKFAEMTLKERFQELRRKGYCFQCLFPGASQSTGKHSASKCQGYLSCKHTSYDKYPTKNHVLVFHEHRRNKVNEMYLMHEKKMHYEAN